jgi:hypothetical protein
VWFEGWTRGRKHSRDNSLLLKVVKYYEHKLNGECDIDTKMLC